VTYHPPVLPPEREEVVFAALEAVELFTAAVVAPWVTVWLRVVQDGNGVAHRLPVRSELTGVVRDRPARHGGATAGSAMVEAGSALDIWGCAPTRRGIVRPTQAGGQRLRR